jgi:hypothetical protein
MAWCPSWRGDAKECSLHLFPFCLFNVVSISFFNQYVSTSSMAPLHGVCLPQHPHIHHLIFILVLPCLFVFPKTVSFYSCFRVICFLVCDVPPKSINSFLTSRDFSYPRSTIPLFHSDIQLVCRYGELKRWRPLWQSRARTVSIPAVPRSGPR